MEIITKNSDHCTCENCKSVLKFDYKDIMWSHVEHDMYYIVCPNCGSYIWLYRTPELDKLWNQHAKEMHIL